MNKIVKRILIILAGLLVVGFFAFLYFIPPFTLAPPEEFIAPERNAPPAVDTIANPATRAIAARGRYLVMSIGCPGCHTPGGDKGPKFDTEYLAGGMKIADPNYGTSVSRNLTPDPATGLARRTNEQVMRALRSGISPDDGRVFSPLFMPWADFSNMSDEDLYAITTYLRYLKPVYHKIPASTPTSELSSYGFFGLDYGIHKGE